MNSTEIKTIELIVNSEQARKRLDELKTKLETIRTKRQEAFEKGDSQAFSLYSKELRKVEREMERTETKAATMSRALENLDKSAPNELKRTLRELQKELNSGKVQRGSAEWQALTKAIRETNAALTDVNRELRETQRASWSDRLAEWGNKWMGLVMNVQAFFGVASGVRGILQQSVSEFAEMEEAKAQVRKYTGLAAEDVDALNESLKKMDTRTSREQLNALAGDAGKLGITAKDQILEFVEAADKINVALGDDLGEGAVKNVGKLAMLFEEDQRLGLKGAMLATASVINELSQNSSAGAAYLEDFTARVAGVGKQAGMTQAQIMAFAAVLDGNMQQDETSATAFSQLITKMYQEPAKFAALAGKDVQEFTRLLKEDANGAILAFLANMKAQGGFESLAPMFQQMGLDGTRATAVLTSLADKLGNVQRMQTLANEAYSEAASINNEFAVQNSTVQAELDKAAKAMKDMRVELGEKLMPVATKMVNFTTLFMKTLSALITFVASHASTIATLTAMIIGYTAAVKAAAIATRAKAAAIVVANTVARAYHATVKALHAAHLLLQLGLAKLEGNWARQSSLMIDVKKAGATVAQGWGALIAAAIALGVAIWNNIQKMRELSATEKAMADIRKHGAEAAVEEKTKLELLHQAAKNEYLSMEERRKAVQKLNAIIPQYNGQLDETTGKYKASEKALTDYCNALVRKYELEGAKEKLQEIGKEVADYTIQKQQAEIELADVKKRAEEAAKRTQSRPNAEGHGRSAADIDMSYIYQTADAAWAANIKAAEKKVDDLQKKIDEKQKVIETINKAYGNALQSEAANATEGNPVGVSGSGVGYTDPKELEKQLKDERDRIENEARARRILKMLEYEQGKISRKEYDEALLDIEMDMLTRQRDIYQKGSEDWNKLEEQRISLRRRVSEQQMQWSEQDIARQEAEANAAAQREYLQGTLSEEQYQRRLDEIKLAHLRNRAFYYTMFGDPKKAKEFTEQADEEDLRQQMQRRKDFLQKAKAMQDEYFKKSLDEREQDELRLLDELVAAGVIAEEKKQQYIEGIQKKYKGLRKDEKDKEDKKEGKKIENPLGNATGIASDFIDIFKKLESLQAKLRDGEATWEDYAAVAVSALAFVGSALSSVSQLYAAQQQAEEAAVTKRYDTEIKKVGENSVKGKKLEEQKQKELAKVKNKYRKKQMSMEVAQAVASTAMAAINAYASAAKVSFLLAPIAAAMALAAGGIQIAAIKKQHAAEGTGYYEGGFTGGKNYRRRAGIVHEGEFVASHLAVQNPNVLPFLRLIDHAQRNNTIASLTAADVSRAVIAPQATSSAVANMPAAAAPVVRIEQAKDDETRDAIRRLNENLEAGIHASVVITGEDGLERQWNRYNRMKARK